RRSARTTMDGELAALRRVMPPPTEPRNLPPPDGWPEIERELGLRLPADYQAFVEVYGSGSVGAFLNVLTPFSDNPNLRLADAAASQLEVYRQIREFERLQFALHPEPGGLFPWGFTDNGDVMFWIMDSPADPSHWSIAVSEVRGPGWFTHPGPFVRFLQEWLVGATEVPFIDGPLNPVYEPAAPWEELSRILEADRAKWRAWDGSSPPPD
ncbi:MAG: SMI1/KNR4 family protein, partial [Chloroflexota bacterium]|nr:SMI1/KNR4 family protein [Chloroflexota bacterium]